MQSNRRLSIYIRISGGLGWWTIPVLGVDIDFKKAVRLNRYYRKALGWEKDYERILKLLGYTTTRPPDEESFAQAVAFWQRNEGLKEVDGIIGKDAWARMQAAMRSRSESARPQPVKVQQVGPPPSTPPRSSTPLDPFPHIRQKRPHEYENALKALYDYEKVKFFFPYYWKLNRAAEDAELKLDDQGNVVLEVKRKSFLELLAEETAKQVIDELRPPETFIFGPKFAFYLGILEQLHTVYTLIQNERLVGKVGQEWDKKRFKRKLSLVMDVMAGDLARRRPGTNPGEWKAWLVHQYRRFEPLFWNWQNYVGMEYSLDPSKPKHQTIGPARF